MTLSRILLESLRLPPLFCFAIASTRDTLKTDKMTLRIGTWAKAEPILG